MPYLPSLKEFVEKSSYTYYTFETLEKEHRYSILKPEKEYAQMVKLMFSRIARRYDFMNHLLSMGLDIRWRRESLRHIDLEKAARFLDLACGTGDLGIFVKELYPKIKVFSVDFSLEMLSHAKRKIKKKGLINGVTFLAGDGLYLPFKDETFDASGIAFGLRNIPNREIALKEMIRVTKKGGKVMVLEMSLKKEIGSIYRIYVERIMPLLAKIFSEDPAAYLYLYDTISTFPSPGELKSEMESAGLSSVEVRSFWPGITHLFIGSKANI